jgi:hypothetical protein
MSQVITDLYKLLFGRKGMAEGSVIDMAEHGRAGGVSTGQGFKATRNVEEKTIIDASVTDIVYIGKSKQGGDTSLAVWQIKKLLTSGGITNIFYADSNDSYDNIWDNRASLTYG